MITKSNPFLRNDYYPDQNDIDELNTRINEVQSDVDLLAIAVNEKTEAVNGRLNTLQNDYNESFETDALKSNLADLNVLNVNVQATIKDLDAEDTYTENLIVNKPVQDLSLRTPHLENTTSLNGNFYAPNIIGGTLDNVQVENIQSFKAVNIEADLFKANVANLNVLNAINIEADVFKANVADLNKVTANTVDLNILNADKVTANTIDLNVLNAINVKADEVKANKLIGDFSAKPISSSAVVGYDENGRLIPIRASYDVSFPEGADYLKTDVQGIARKGTSESEVVQSTNLIQAGAVQNMYDAVIANFNNADNNFNDISNSFNEVNSFVNNGFNDVNNYVSNSFDSINNNFSTNYLTVNDNVVVDGNNFTHKGFDVTSMTVISEDEYNNLGADKRNQTFYMTTPNGNLYFYGIKFAAANVPKEYVAYVSLPDMANAMASLERSTLTFISGNVVNTFVNNGAYVSIWEVTSLGGNVQNDTAPVGTRESTGSIVTNANKLYITNAASMYSKCTNLIDTFICNPSLIIGAPENYDPMEHCTNMFNMFSGCTNFNQPVNIPDGTTDISSMFSEASKFNQPITIPNSVTNMSKTFSKCYELNQPVVISNNVANMANTFENCWKFNQPVEVHSNADYVNTDSIFIGCRVFNQPVSLPNNIGGSFMFDNCWEFNQPIDLNFKFPSSKTFYDILWHCNEFNSPVNISTDNNVKLREVIMSCHNFNAPVYIDCPGSSYFFSDCPNFNAPVTLSNRVKSCYAMFRSLQSFNQPIDLNNVQFMEEMFALSNYNQPLHIPANARFAGILEQCSNYKQPDIWIHTIPKLLEEWRNAFRGATIKHYHFPANASSSDKQNIINSLQNGSVSFPVATDNIFFDIVD